MRALLSIVLLGSFALCAPAKAEFTVLPSASHAAEGIKKTQPKPAKSLNKRKPQHSQQTGGNKNKTAILKPKSSLEAQAIGFGSQIPLSFALKQIVPPHMTIQFGPGITPDVLVDWRGGREWKIVLEEAVQPLGIHVSVKGQALVLSL
ncbi:hypothetical protein [Beijerinckia indica]|uniref:Uncharacterized protein n=1 Tax=Beijerinckia indica subsp. indica (strain ATCC 9039 / DSM 1715 / NCIMB 8712) TaxID=395963 RepID=B2ILI8_BEII9|nr:hypothetical protein [Beijerinckia indica]ACB97388.1 hypothetical protein Bind_3859 [Beijerinckia indica subsp. indica ATCC 9039]